MDLQAIATAIAAQIGTVTANGETATATARLPNQAGTLELLVYPPSGDLGIGVSRRRDDHYSFPIRLLRDPVDVPSRTDALYAWANALRDTVEANMDLGLAYVAWARADSLRLALDGEQYAAFDGTRGTFDVVELMVTVRVDEVVATVAI